MMEVGGVLEFLSFLNDRLGSWSSRLFGVAALSLVFGLALEFAGIRSHQSLTDDAIQLEIARLDQEWAGLSTSSAISNREKEAASGALRREIRGYQIEQWIRTLNLPALALALSGLIGSLFVALFMGFAHSKGWLPTRFSGPTLDADCVEQPPREEYVTDAELYYRLESGFQARSELIAFLSSDTVRKCPYCAGRLGARPGSEKFKIQPVNFFKKVPENAIDQRLRLAAVWQVVNPPEVVCNQCASAVKL